MLVPQKPPSAVQTCSSQSVAWNKLTQFRSLRVTAGNPRGPVPACLLLQEWRCRRIASGGLVLVHAGGNQRRGGGFLTNAGLGFYGFIVVKAPPEVVDGQENCW